MKGTLLILLCCLCTAAGGYAQRKKPTDSVTVVIRLSNSSYDKPVSDSVLVIFDRFDHSGAGVIKKVFFPVNNKIVIGKVPPARYYIAVYYLGPHREKFTELTFVNNRHSNVFSYRVKSSDHFTPGLAVIPVEPVDISKLRIFEEVKAVKGKSE